MNDRPPTLNDILAGHFVLKRDIGGGRYTLKREIGRGGAATVYLARDERHERFVAIKILHPELSHALGAQRFLREIKLTASLQHPHILPIHDSGETADQLYYVMPFIEGDSLRQRLGADNRLSIEEAVRVGREVAGALAYAHERGIVHRDIKPENILFSGGHAVVADFGIARAIDRASEKITQQGTITGTPAYMSPEQARDRAFDGRSDVYSLACVLYEAIAGVPPFPGETPQQQLSARLTKTPPLLHEYRHDVPGPIETVIAKALATSPDDRYPDARAFSAALSAAIGHSGETLTARAARRSWRKSPWPWAAGVALAAFAVAMSPPVRVRIERLTVRVDSAQYAVVPFQYVGSAPPNPAADPAAGGVYESLKRWEGLKLASDVSVQDAVRDDDGDDAHLVDDVMRVARSVHAGRVVWGRVTTGRDSSVVRVGLYDALTGESLREVTRSVSARGANGLRGIDYRALVADLLRSPHASDISARADLGTSSYAAWQAFQRGAVALTRWDVGAATTALDSAVTLDPAYPQANLWLAQVKSWRRAPAKEWATAYIAADKGRAALDPRERLLADALGALSRDDYPAACASYSALRSRDSLDAIAWLGLASCQAYDRLVVRAPDSPTGWGFRGSYEAAWRAATRALELAPESFGALPSEFLRQIALMEHNRFRTGQAGALRFGALPDLRGDTVAYVPYPIAEFRVGRSTATYDAALRHNRDRMLSLLESLTQRMPGSADVFEAMTVLLETRDEIIGTPNGRYSALSALERARALSTDPEQRLRLAAADVRLHLKLADFARATATADSVLNAERQSPASHASQLAALAAFAGRTGLAIRYMRASGPSSLRQGAEVVPATNDALASLLVRAALGVCDDSARALPAAIVRTLTSYVGAADRQQTADALLERPVSLAVPCTGPGATQVVSRPSGPLMLMQHVAARGDRAGVRRMLDSLAETRRGMRPGGVSLDYIIQEAWLADFAGDPRHAADRLDIALTALPTLSSFIVTEPVMAASVGRAMAYRAELAARLNDPSSAELWASRVLTLWSRADASLEPTLVRMRRLAARQPLS
ncbi:MAG TPA: serine/threonine-protein kinase [Gemmatimonadaceae bacterium]|nr:serine/threonine-protein kinase [Gemmatimonadaceae bacterium]